MDGTYVLSLTVSDGTVRSQARFGDDHRRDAELGAHRRCGSRIRRATGSVVTLNGGAAPMRTAICSATNGPSPPIPRAKRSRPRRIRAPPWPTFTAERGRHHVLSLTVSDGTVRSQARFGDDHRRDSRTRRPPPMRVPDQNVATGSVVTLNGGGRPMRTAIC